MRFGDIYWNNLGPRIRATYHHPENCTADRLWNVLLRCQWKHGRRMLPLRGGVSASPTPTSPDGISPAFKWDNGFQLPAGLPSRRLSVPAARERTIGACRVERGRARRPHTELAGEHPTGSCRRHFCLDVAYLAAGVRPAEQLVPYNQVDPKYLSSGSLLSASVTDPRVVRWDTKSRTRLYRHARASSSALPAIQQHRSHVPRAGEDYLQRASNQAGKAI